MTKEEARRLEKRCDKIMTGYLGVTCKVSMAWTGKLKVELDDGVDNYIAWNMDYDTVDYIRYVGFYDNLLELIDNIRECIDDNRDIFEKLLWSYTHRNELEEDENAT